MENRPFTFEELPKRGFLSRLSGRAPREGSFVEVRNMLTKTPWRAVSPADLVKRGYVEDPTARPAVVG